MDRTVYNKTMIIFLITDRRINFAI